MLEYRLVKHIFVSAQPKNLAKRAMETSQSDSYDEIWHVMREEAPTPQFFADEGFSLVPQNWDGSCLRPLKPPEGYQRYVYVLEVKKRNKWSRVDVITAQTVSPVTV